MNINRHIVSQGPLVFAAVDHEGESYLKLPGAEISMAKGPFGTYIIQELKDELYVFQYNVLNIVKRISVGVQAVKGGLLVRFILQHPLNHKQVRSSEITAREGDFLKLPVNDNLFSTQYEPNSQYVHIDICLSKVLVDEVLTFFPEMDLASLPLKSTRADGEMHEIIDSILRIRYKDELRKHYFNSYIKDLTIRCLVQWSHVEPESGLPTEREKDCVYEAEKIISADISRHFTIPQLARKVKLSEFRFKIVFKRMFGISVYKYLQAKRLNEARKLLEQGYSVKEVAAETGYHISHFTTLFREHFKIRPSSYKRKK